MPLLVDYVCVRRTMSSLSYIEYRLFSYICDAPRLWLSYRLKGASVKV